MNPALVLAALLQAATPAPPASPAATAGPRIVIDPQRVDLGRVLTRRTLTRPIQVRNAGTADLVIERVTSSCDCAVAKGYESVVKPGRSITLRLSLDTRANPGRVVRSLLVHSNDPTRPQVELRVEATVVAGGDEAGR
ncbi:MAG TPA: DUF1573 domain-containing protein [Vicinamibacteria bacterium]